MDGNALDILLCLLQINVAIGILYIGLPTARYRNRLHSEITKIMRGRESEIERVAYRDAMLNQKFADTHYYVSMWLQEIPDSYSRKIPFTEIEQVSKGRWSLRSIGSTTPRAAAESCASRPRGRSPG